LVWREHFHGPNASSWDGMQFPGWLRRGFLRKKASVL